MAIDIQEGGLSNATEKINTFHSALETNLPKIVAELNDLSSTWIDSKSATILTQWKDDVNRANELSGKCLGALEEILPKLEELMRIYN